MLNFFVKTQSVLENGKSIMSKVHKSCAEELITLTIFNQMRCSAQTLKFRQKKM